MEGFFMCKICRNSTKILSFNNVFYRKCFSCDFLFKTDEYILSSESEFERYKLHNNNDLSYFSYQKSFYFSIKEFLSGKVLDYGCGDNHILASIIMEEGYDSSFYDLYFYNNEYVLKNSYDSIILEEVIEHLKDPIKEIKKLLEILNKNGKIIIRTQFLNDELDLSKWWYLRDSTHISFFSIKTFIYICELFNLKIIYCNDKDLIVLQKV